MIDIESTVVESMRARADAAPPTATMHERVMSRAAGMRRRRRVLGGAAVAAVVVGAIAAVPAAPVFTDRGRDSAEVATQPRTTPATPQRSPGPTTLPELADVPAAADRPVAVGTDPLTLHFDVYLASINVTASVWASGAGYETFATPYGKNGEFVEVLIGADPAVLDNKRIPPGLAYIAPGGKMIPAFTENPIATVSVAGRPATVFSVIDGKLDDSIRPDAVAGVTGFAPSGVQLPAFVLRWQPADGLHAIVQTRGYDRSLVEKVAGALRLDRAQRCATPLRFTAPVGGVVTECRTSVRQTPVGTAGAWLASSFSYAMPGGATAGVWTELKPERVAHDLNQFRATHTINGAKAQWRHADPAGLWLLEYGPAPAEVFISGLGEAESVQLVQGLTFGPDLNNVVSWPAGPSG
jgi:hypothetical protein